LPVFFPPIAAPFRNFTSISGVIRSTCRVALVKDVLCENRNEGISRGFRSRRGSKGIKRRKEKWESRDIKEGVQGWEGGVKERRDVDTPLSS
jgi:hypothetical protein